MLRHKHYCYYCDYLSEIKLYYKRHLLTKKHQINYGKHLAVLEYFKNI